MGGRGGLLPFPPGEVNSGVQLFASSSLWPGCPYLALSPSLSPSITELQAHWPFCCSANLLSPQALCTCCFLCQEGFLRPPHAQFLDITQVFAQLPLLCGASLTHHFKPAPISSLTLITD